MHTFVAAHDGHASGYLAEVFHFCAPGIVVISDTAIEAKQDSGYVAVQLTLI